MILNFFSIIPVIGPIIGIFVMVILYVPFLLFSGRFSALVYDTGMEKPGTVSSPENARQN
jgi:hypothetical protein